MKKSLLSAFPLALLLAVATPVALADALQNGAPGAQGTEGTNPTHQDISPTGPNGEHATNTNPLNEPAAPHHMSTTSSCNGSTSSCK